MLTRDLDYHLPPDRIATTPADPRDASRLLVVHPSSIEHRIFRDLPAFLRPGDLLVVNNTRVLNAKLALRRASAAQTIIPGLFLQELSPGTWKVLLRTRGRVRPGQTLLAPNYSFLLTERLANGQWLLQITPPHPAHAILQAIGHTPLPPYISRQRKHLGIPEESPNDPLWYQTVYAHPLDPQSASTGVGSVAAPTAGLHFTPTLLEQLTQMGVQLATVDLEVGQGTFLPIESPTLEEHPMHAERYHIPAETITALRTARAQNRRIIPVGTTAVRTLESAAPQILTPPTQSSVLSPQSFSASTSLLISPGFRFQLTDALITNFHLPKSTLLALVAAFLDQQSPTTGLPRLKSLYAEAIAQSYRFYSYGDAMLVLPSETSAPPGRGAP